MHGLIQQIDMKRLIQHHTELQKTLREMILEKPQAEDMPWCNMR